MAGRRPSGFRLALGAVAAASAVWAAAASQPYLPAAGPAALRFFVPESTTNPVCLAAWPVSPPPVSALQTNPPGLAQGSTHVPVVEDPLLPLWKELTGEAWLPGAGGTNGSAGGEWLLPAMPGAPYPAGGAGPPVSAQAFLQLFRPVGTNGAGGALLVPVFVPPSPPSAAPASSATYRSQ